MKKERHSFSREVLLEQIKSSNSFDIVIIGGGATGLGVAIDATNRGLKTLLLEKYDFGKGTSSRSTKLLHGGVRYLAQGNIRLVFEALKERGLLMKNAKHLSSVLSFIIPTYSFFSLLKYYLGLKIYSLMSGKLNIGNTSILSSKKILSSIPTISKKKLVGGIKYFDGQFDDARLCINLFQTAIEKGAIALNHTEVKTLKKVNGRVSGLSFFDHEGNQKYSVKSKVVVNATGVFSNDIFNMDDSISKKTHIVPSQGVHLVVDKKHYTSNHAMMIPKTTDGRVLFIIPWSNVVLIGTTDTVIKNIEAEPTPLEEEINFILHNTNKYLKVNICRTDIISTFVGLRPLVTSQKNSQKTKEISRSHKVIISKSKLVSIIGGKWTTYRKMAEDLMIEVKKHFDFQYFGTTTTHKLPIHGSDYNNLPTNDTHLKIYGSDYEKIKTIEKQENAKELIHHDYPYTKAHVIWALRYEMAISLEDVLARRIRILFFNVSHAIEVAEKVADWMTEELNKNEYWKQQQLENFLALIKKYSISM